MHERNRLGHPLTAELFVVLRKPRQEVGKVNAQVGGTGRDRLRRNPLWLAQTTPEPADRQEAADLTRQRQHVDRRQNPCVRFAPANQQRQPKFLFQVVSLMPCQLVSFRDGFTRRPDVRGRYCISFHLSLLRFVIHAFNAPAGRGRRPVGNTGWTKAVRARV